jgi:hypothetical protein
MKREAHIASAAFLCTFRAIGCFYFIDDAALVLRQTSTATFVENLIKLYYYF